jgi:hypothetical protein
MRRNIGIGVAAVSTVPALVFGVSALDAKPVAVVDAETTQPPAELTGAPLRSAWSYVVGACFDKIYGTITGHVRGALHFGTGGWGDIERAHAGMRRLREEHPKLVEHCEQELEVQWVGDWERAHWGGWRRDGYFTTPVAFLCGRESAEEQLFLEGITVPFRHVLPADALREGGHDGEGGEEGGRGAGEGGARASASAAAPAPAPESQGAAPAVRRLRDDVPLCIHLPCNGDKGFAWREEHFAEQLARDEGVGSIIYEAPYMGQRRDGRKRVRGAQWDRVSDVVSVGTASVAEVLALVLWARGASGVHTAPDTPVCLAGISMGAEVAAGLFDAQRAIRDGGGRALDLDLVAVMPVHSGVPVFCHGVMGDVSDWGALCSEAGLESEAAARQRVEEAIELTDITKHEYAPAADGLAVRRRAIVIGAVDDGYMPEWSIRATAAHLAKHHDVKLQWIGGGHCSTVVARKALVRDAIVDVLKRPPAIGHS